MSDIAAKVKAIIIDKLGVDAKEVTQEASFTNDLGADSLDTGDQPHELLRLAGVRHAQDDVAANDHAEIAVDRFGRVKEE